MGRRVIRRARCRSARGAVPTAPSRPGGMPVMWTPKRIGLFGAALLVLVGGYLGYARTYFGGIDGLPPLPDKYHHDPSGAPEIQPLPRGAPVEARLKQAFGPDCPELKRA